MCYILSCYFWSVHVNGVFELQTLVSDFADVLDAPFLLEEARIYWCAPVRRSGTEMIYQTVSTQSDCAHRSSMIMDCTV